jgi:hypothetical protein
LGYDKTIVRLHVGIIIIIIIIIIGKDTISFMQGIYTYIRETNHAPKEYCVAALLSLLFMVPISLAPALALMYVYTSTFRIIIIIIIIIIAMIIIITITIIISVSAAQHGLWPPRSRGFVITHNDAPQSVGHLCTSDQLVAETPT